MGSAGSGTWRDRLASAGAPIVKATAALAAYDHWDAAHQGLADARRSAMKLVTLARSQAFSERSSGSSSYR
jgi:hypothetical protein